MLSLSFSLSPSEEDAMPTTHLCGKVMKPNSAIPGAVAGRLPLRPLSRGLLSRQALGAPGSVLAKPRAMLHRSAPPKRETPTKARAIRGNEQGLHCAAQPCRCAGSDGERRYEEFHQRETQLC